MKKRHNTATGLSSIQCKQEYVVSEPIISYFEAEVKCFFQFNLMRFHFRMPAQIKQIKSVEHFQIVL